jgi:DNA repair ATPase RecN
VSYWWYFNTAHPGATKMLLWRGTVNSDGTVSGTPALSATYENNVLNVTLATIPLPQGFYTISVESSVQGGLDPVGNTYLSVVPKLYIEPVVVVGPAMLKVEGYGFPAAEALEFIAPILNGSDAIAGVNLHMRMLSTWTIDANGTLTSIGFGNVNIEPGIYLPVLEPGAYNVQLVYRITSTGSYSVTAPTTVYVINNVSKIVSSDYIDQKFQTVNQHLTDIEEQLASGFLDVALALGQIQEQISHINVSVDLGPIMTELSNIETAIGTVQLDVTTIRNKVETVPANILSAIYGVDSKVDSLSSAVSSLSDSVSNVGSKVDSLATSVSSIGSDVSQIKSLVADVPNIASKISGIEGAVSQIVQALDNLPSSVADSLAGLLNQIKSSADAAKSSADAAKSEIDAKATELSSSLDQIKTDLGSKVDTTQTAVYLAVIFALLAFITAIVAVLMIRKSSAA